VFAAVLEDLITAGEMPAAARHDRDTPEPAAVDEGSITAWATFGAALAEATATLEQIFATSSPTEAKGLAVQRPGACSARTNWLATARADLRPLAIETTGGGEADRLSEYLPGLRGESRLVNSGAASGAPSAGK
jgi:hypothetical protein